MTPDGGYPAGWTAPITACRHWVDGRQEPCPRLCPRQDWPRSMFRLNWRGHYILRRRYRKTASDAVQPGI